MTALDFVRSYRRLLTPSFGAPYADRFYYVAGAEAYHRGTLRDFSQTGFQALDPQRRTYKQYEVKGIPHVVVLDPDGVVRWEGYPLLDGHELSEKVIEGLLPAKKA